MNGADILKSRGLGLWVRRDVSGSSDEVGATLPANQRGNPSIGDLARLLRAYPDEFLYLPFIPVPVQRALAVPLSKIGSGHH